MPPATFTYRAPSTPQPSREDLAIYIYCVSLVAVVTATVTTLVSVDIQVGPPLAIAALAGMAYMVEQQTIQLNGTTWLSVAFLPLLFSAVAFGPLAAMIVAGASLLADFGPPYIRWTVWTTTRMIVGAGAGVVTLILDPSRFGSFSWLVMVVAVAVAAEGLLDLGLGMITLVLRRSGSARALGLAFAPIFVVSVPLYAPVIAVLIYAYHTLSPWVLILFILPGVAIQQLLLLYRKQRDTADELIEVNDRLERANLSFAIALVATLDARDPYTSGHSAAVSRYARAIAIEMDLSVEEQRLAEVCGLVHDVGKVGLPPGLLEKAGPLTHSERVIMERHSSIGERILGKVDDYAEIATIVRHHHERIDGKGYPDGLKGDVIPLISRIVAVADAYDAMTSTRAYRGAMPSSVARMRLAQGACTQFDSRIVTALDAILATTTELGRVGDYGPELPQRPFGDFRELHEPY